MTRNAAEALRTTLPQDQPFFVAPLSIQPDDGDFLVGSVELDDFYQFPPEAVDILTELQQGRTLAAIKISLAERASAETVDVDDFVGTLVEIGFAYPAAQRTGYDERLATHRDSGDRRLVFRCDPRIAAAVFSRAGLVLYLVVLVVAVGCAIAYPAARLHFSAFFVERHLAATLVLLLLLSSAQTALHELGHMIAAAKHGLVSRLGIGNRLWNIVAEADLSGILSLPRRERYLPLMAGMVVDVLGIAVVTILIALIVRGGGGEGFAVALLQAFMLQIVVGLTWQFNIFLRTDLYYVLCTRFSAPDLDADARAYVGHWLHRLSLGQLGHPYPGGYRNLSMARGFALVWLVGRILALITLAVVILPTLWRYALRAWRTFRDPAATPGTVIDISTFVVASILIVAFGLYMWLRQRRSPRPLEGSR